MIKENLKNLAYSFLNLINGGKGIVREINGMKVRFPAKWSRYYESDYEAENYNFLRDYVKPGMHVIDIGAHIGLFSATCSTLVGPKGKIVSFEPTPGTFNVLRETLTLNQCNNVQPVQAAVSNRTGTDTFYISHVAACNSNSLVKNKEGDEVTAYDVKLVTIDSIITDNLLQPSLIKIEAEGAELDVLKGGTTTFATYKPVLILGLHPDFIRLKGDSLEEIWDLLVANKYEIRKEKKVMMKTDFCNQPLIFDVHCF